MADQSNSGSPKADWYADPLGRYQFRYWDGMCWTHHVASYGEASIDPLDAPPAKGRSASPAAESRQASAPDMAGNEAQFADSTKEETRGPDASVPAPDVADATDPVERLAAELRAKMNNREDAKPIVWKLASLCDARSVPLLLEVARGGSGEIGRAHV